MSKRNYIYTFFAIVLAGVAIFFGSSNPEAVETTARPPNPGRNNTILFLSDNHRGFANVLLATNYAVLTRYPHIETHYASFPKLSKAVSTISTFAQKQEPLSRAVTFHELPSLGYGETLGTQGHFIQQTIHDPGWRGVSRLCETLQDYLMPWSGEAYLAIYLEIIKIIEEVNPAVIALDPMFGAAIDATRFLNRSHAIISPNSLKENFADRQPAGSVLWKYPAIGSGLSYPIPWSRIPENIYINLYLAYTVIFAPKLKGKRAFLKENGIAKARDIFSTYQPDILWISPTLPEADFPFPNIPSNVKTCGPISLSTAPAIEQDPELTSWLTRSPTILINLGSAMNYDYNSTIQMLGAIRHVLSHSPVQVLWKYNKRENSTFTSSIFSPLAAEIESGRLRMEKWIDIDPAAILETGNVVVSVHHGGASCYWEAVGTGVPHIILPQWADLYDYAARVEWLGIGIWGSKKSAPSWTEEELGEAFLEIVGNSTRAVEIRRKAREIGEIAKQRPGRERAADELAVWAARGEL